METVLKNWTCALSGHFFLARNYLQSWPYKNLKGKSVLFSFLYSFIFLSLPSFLYFLPVYMAWRKTKSLVKSRCGVEFFSTISINPDIYISIGYILNMQRLLIIIIILCKVETTQKLLIAKLPVFFLWKKFCQPVKLGPISALNLLLKIKATTTPNS